MKIDRIKEKNPLMGKYLPPKKQVERNAYESVLLLYDFIAELTSEKGYCQNKLLWNPIFLLTLKKWYLQNDYDEKSVETLIYQVGYALYQKRKEI